MRTIPCAYVLAAPLAGSILLCGEPVNVYDQGRPLCVRHDPGVNYVYFVRRGGHLKVGMTTRPEQRLRDVMAGVGNAAPADLSGDPALLALVPGDLRTERLFHGAFADFRTTGEWFTIAGRLAAFVDTLSAASPSLVSMAAAAELHAPFADDMDSSIGVGPVDF